MTDHRPHDEHRDSFGASTVDTLHDAFAELELRADAAPVRVAAPPARRSRPLLVAASVGAVLAVAVGATALADHDRGHTNRTGAGVPAAGRPATAAHAAPARSSAPRSTAAQSPRTVSRHGVPTDSTELQKRFGSVLAAALPGTSSFAVTYASDTPGDPAINGVLTYDGVQGGYDVQVMKTGPHDTAFCDDPDRSTCTVTTLPDGASLAIGSEPLEGPPGGVTFEGCYVHAGYMYLLHVSNLRDPKGDSKKLAVDPPLTKAQVKAVVMSPAWRG